MEYDFSGWATRNNLKCSDGRVILKDAFKHNDGQTVPLVWNHQHNDPLNILGHAQLENRDEGVYAYCTFNDTESGQAAKTLVRHGDVTALSIYANRLKQRGSEVFHGAIREVSLVLAGANPGAFIENVIAHGDSSDEEAIISFINDDISLSHAEGKKEEEESNMANENEETVQDVFDTLSEKQKTVVYAIIGQALEDAQAEHGDYDEDFMMHAGEDGEETVQDVFNTLSEKQKTVVYAIIGQALEDAEAEHSDIYDDYEGGTFMKHNVFDQEEIEMDGVLTHADQTAILTMAKSNSCGSFRDALEYFVEDNSLQHGYVDGDGNDAIDWLFPEYKDVRPGAPELITRDYSWISGVMNGVHKSPISRIRTRQNDIRSTDLRSLGYKKGDKKTEMANMKLMKRTTDPQTVYIKSAMHRDDIIDITDFDVVNYQWGIMRGLLDEEIALAIMIGDGREDGDENKIDESHIRSIWHDDELYTIHYDVDVEAARAELQGSDTSKHFGENYVYAEAIIAAALYSREKYKGSGNLDFYCTPHLLNVMLLARDLNGRRLYDSKTDLAAALNVKAIHTVEQFEGKTRKTATGDEKKLLGLFVNLSDYQVGCTKGGEISKFSDFDIDFNQEKYLIETRLSGALTRVYSAIALEEPVAAVEG